MTAERIKKALFDLNSKMDQLEQDFEVKSKAVKTRAKPSIAALQQDLFGAPAKPKAANDAAMKAVASKLDSAIAKVQKMLVEAEA